MSHKGPVVTFLTTTMKSAADVPGDVMDNGVIATGKDRLGKIGERTKTLRKGITSLEFIPGR